MGNLNRTAFYKILARYGYFDTLDQEGATYGPRRQIFLALTLPFWLKCGPREIIKGAMWPADENSCPPLHKIVL
jgi:hypothetical protein